MKFGILFLVVTYLANISVFGQGIERKTAYISESTGEIVIDGILNDVAWDNVQPARDFIQTFPYDTALSKSQCEIFLTYNSAYLYAGIKCNDTSPKDEFVMISQRRDFRGAGIESVNLMFDTFQDQTNAYSFGINPYGIQREGLIANGGTSSTDLSLNWDNKWFSEAYIGEGYWSAELAIPFKTLRFPEGSSRWLFNAYRVDSKTNERTAWNRVPQNFRPYSLSYTGELIWDKPLPKPGTNISVIPYIAGGVSKSFEEGQNTQIEREVGGDVKIALTPSMSLDLTFNPDFSQVEVDRQVTNVDRFEIFFPERRQFFLENADLFASFGTEDARPFFSRRIGVAIDTATGSNVQNRIIGGFRLNGKLNDRLRIGLLNMQAAEDNSITLPSLNYTVAAVQQQVFSRSNISAIFVNKQSFNRTFTDKLFDEPVTHNRILGLDYNLASQDNTITGKAFYHRSFQKQSPKEQYSHGASFLYSTRVWNIEWNHALIGENYNAEVGFVRRIGVNNFNPEISYKLYPKVGIINNHGPGATMEYFWDDNGRTDQLVRPFYDIRFQNNASARASFNFRYTRLLNEFDPTRTPDEDEVIPLPSGSDYKYNSYFIRYQSDPRKRFKIEVRHSGGQYFNGSRYNVNPELTYRFQPYGSVTVQYSYNRISLDKPFASRSIHLISPRLDLTMSKKVFFTNFLQFNTQNENVNINSRFQWRFKPASDLFIVYTDNYFFSFENPNDNWMPRTRALVFKMTYWLNL